MVVTKKNVWAVWTSIALITLVGTFMLVCTIYCCLKNVQIERREKSIENGEAMSDADDGVDVDDKSEQAKAGTRAQRKSKRPIMYLPPPPPSAFIVVQ